MIRTLLLTILLSACWYSVSSAVSHTGIIVDNGMVSSSSDCVIGDRDIRQEKRSLPPYERIIISGAFDVKLHCGKDSAAVLTMDANILPLIETTVQNDTLTIENGHSVCVNNPLQLSLTTLAIKQLAAEGANDIMIDCSGYDTLEITLEGASTLKLNGKGKHLTAHLEDAAELDAENNQLQSARITTQDSSTATVNATDSITARSSDASEIYYNASVARIQKAVTDAGDILPLFEK